MRVFLRINWEKITKMKGLILTKHGLSMMKKKCEKNDLPDAQIKLELDTNNNINNIRFGVSTGWVVIMTMNVQQHLQHKYELI